MIDRLERLDACNYCGRLNAERHKHHTNMCVDCGKLYDRFKKAKRCGVASELSLTKRLILANKQKAAPERQQQYYKMIEQTEVEEMKEVTSKICKQCGRVLDIDNFRKYKARGRGIYNTTQGHNTICKECESISNRIAGALSKGDQDMLDKLTNHYKILLDKGFPPVTVAAKRLLGMHDDVKAKRSSFDSLLAGVQGTNESPLEAHCRLVRTRGYASIDEASQKHKELEDQLKQSGLYEEITELLDDWYMED